MCSCPVVTKPARLLVGLVPRPRSCTPISTPSTHPSSSVTIPRCAAGPSSSAAEWFSRPATRPRPTACAPRWAVASLGNCARRRSSSHRECRRTRRPAADVFDVFRDTSPLVEPLSVDEAFLDVSGLARVSGTPVQIGARLREQVRDRVGLPITVGIARTKFLAKVASQEAKPDGLLLVPPDRELAFLHPLPVRRLWGVGREDRGEAARPRHPHRRRRGGAWRDDVGITGRRGDGPPTVRAVAQRRPTPRGHGRAQTLGRRAAGARSGRKHDVAHRGRRRRGESRRPDHPSHAQGGPYRSDGRAAAALRRLRPRHQIVHAAAGHGVDRRDPLRGKGFGGCRCAPDRRTRPDAGGLRRVEHRSRRGAAAGAAVPAARPTSPPSTPPWIWCAPASATRR